MFPSVVVGAFIIVLNTKEITWVLRLYISVFLDDMHTLISLPVAIFAPIPKILFSTGFLQVCNISVINYIIGDIV